MQRRTNLILAAAAAIALLGLTQPAGAAVVSSNGTGVDGCPGTGEVAVTLGTFNGGCEDPDSVAVGKVFFEVVDHEMEWEFTESNQGLFFEAIENQTGDLWKDFHISFETIAAVSFDIPELGVDVDADVVRMDGEGIIEFWIFFDEPLLSGDLFLLSGAINSDEATQRLTVRQHPSVPEPGSLALFATGLLALALIARRRRRVAA